MFALLLILCPAGPALAETRIALVIGINAYQSAPALTTPVNDAQAIGDALRRLNFDVDEVHDPDFATLNRAIRDFGIRAQKAETALVYYAGHGVQVDRENYLIPADAKLERARDLAYEAVPLSRMLEEVAQARKIGIVLLDSCRNNPFIDRFSHPDNGASRAVAVTQGLARVDNVPANLMVVMAAKADQVAADGSEHSPFAAAVLAHFQIPGLELGLFFRSVRDTVLRATQNRQEPYVFSSLGAEPFYFYPRPPNRPPVIGPIPVLQVAVGAGATPLGIPPPTDPDMDLLTVRIIGLPRNGEVRVDGRKAGLGESFSLDHFVTGTFTPDGTASGPSGTLEILVEDGRGGSVTGSLPIVVMPPGQARSPQPAAAQPVSAVPFGLAEARDLALGVPCALIDVRDSPGQPGRLLVSGPTLPGAAFDAFLHRIESSGRTAGVATEPLDPGHCAALAVMTDLVRRSRETVGPRLIAPAAPVPVGGSFVLSVKNSPGAVLYVDLYAADGSVRHLRRGVVPANTAESEVTITASAAGPPGQHLLVAITTAAPLNLAQRPVSESETAYLPVLQRELARAGAGDRRADIATLSVIAASRPVAVPSRPASEASRMPARCQDIVARVALGDTLSDGDRTILRTSCGR